MFPQPLRQPATAVLLAWSLWAFGALGWAFRADGALQPADVDLLYPLAWAVLPVVGVTALWAVPVAAYRAAAGTGAVYLAGAAWALRLLDAPGPFNRILLALLVGFVGVQVAVIVGQRFDRQLIAAPLAVLLAVVGVWAAATAPLTITDTYQGARVTFRAASALADEDTRLSWTADGIAEIYINGVPTVGTDETTITSPNLAQSTLRVIFPDGTQRDYTLSLNGAVEGTRAVLYTVAACVVMFVALAAAIPAAWGVLAPVGAVLLAAPFAMVGYLLPLDRVLWGFGLAAVVVGLWATLPPPPRWASRLITPAAVLVVLLLGLNIALPYDRHHYNFFMGPVNDVLGGRTMFVEGANQYGMLITYVLAGAFRLTRLPLTYEGFSLLVGVLGLAQFAAIYVLLRRATERRWPALVGMFLMTLVYVVRAYAGQHTHPSSGALRYGLLYALLLTVALGGTQRWRAALPLAITAFAAAWSLETGAFTLALYAALVTLEAVALAPTRRAGLWSVTWKVGAAVGLGVLAVGAFHLFSTVRAGQPPDWAVYLAFFEVYSGTAWLVDLWSPWFPATAALYAGLTAALVHLLQGNRRDLLRYQVPVGVALIGVMGLYYWVRVPFTVTLGAYALPSVFLGVYGLARTADAPPGLRWASRWTLTGVALAVTLTAFTTPLPRTPIHTPAHELAATVRAWRAPRTGLARLANPPPTYIEYERANEIDQQVMDLVALIDTYAPDAPRLLVSTHPETATDALIRTGKQHLYPTSHPAIEDRYNPVAQAKVLAYQPPLHAGDVIFFDQDETTLDDIGRAQLGAARAQFAFEPLTVTPSGLVAVRLAAR